MTPKLVHKAAELTRTLWFTPLVLAIVGVGLGISLPAVDRMSWAQEALSGRWAKAILASSPDGARQLLGAGAGTLATILGVAFSLTLVTLQLAAQQYTPRLIGRLMDDFITKLVLGSYIGTTAYLLLVLRAVHGESPPLPQFIPSISIVVGLVLFLYCLALLAVFLHHLGRSTQATSVIAGVSRKAVERIRRGELCSRNEPRLPAPTAEPFAIEANTSGYVQVIDLEQIARDAPAGSTFVRVEVSTGDYVFVGQRLAAVWPGRPVEDAEVAKLRAAFDLGEERTPERDLLLAVQQISDVALKALSPSVNDETTGVEAVNELGAIGAEMARAGVPRAWYRRAHRDGLVVVAPALGMERFLRDGFREVIRNAAAHPRVLSRVAEALSAIAALSPRSDARAAVVEAAEWVSAAATRLPAGSRVEIEGKLALLHCGRPDRTALP